MWRSEKHSDVGIYGSQDRTELEKRIGGRI